MTLPRISDLRSGRIDMFSAGAQIEMPACLGATVRLTVKIRPAARGGRLQ